jgi:YD repeat-containing protein
MVLIIRCKYSTFNNCAPPHSNKKQTYTDAEGRAIGITAYSGKQTRVEYRDSEGITITTYTDGTQDTVERDRAGNIIRISNGTGTIRYAYDVGGNLIEQRDEGAGEATRYVYDGAGRRVRMTSGNRDVQYRYGRNNELLRITDVIQRLEASYEYDNRGRETRRIYGNGVRQETLCDQIGRVILVKETDSMNRLLRAEGYVYDEKGRRSHSADEEGKVTKYEYNNKSQLVTALYPWTQEKSESDRKETEEAGLYFTADRGNWERYTFSAIEVNALREDYSNSAVVLILRSFIQPYNPNTVKILEVSGDSMSGIHLF